MDLIRTFGFIGIAIQVVLFGNGYTLSAADTVENVLIDSNGVACEIVVPDDAGTMARFAGEELKKFMTQSFQKEVPLLKTPSSNAKTSIILGDNQFLRSAGVDISSIPRDGFVIKTVGNRIFIAGKDNKDVNVQKAISSSAWHRRNTLPQRGTLNGVYEFLERYLGARFYFPGKFGTIVPKHDNLKLPAIKRRISPDNTARSMGTSGKLYDGFDVGYSGANSGKKMWRYKTLDKLRLRLQTKYIPHCHGLRSYGHIKRFSQSHPEYFALKNNGERYNNPNDSHKSQLCYSSGIRNEIYKDATVFLSGKSAKSRGVEPRGRGKMFWSPTNCQPGYFDIMPQDGFYPCHCPKCQKHFDGLNYESMDKKKTTEFMWGFFCEIAEKLKKNNIPGYVTTMAYPPYAEVPERDIPDNVMVALCPSPADAGNLDKTVEFVKSWSEKLHGRKLWLWNNFGKYSELSMPGVPFVVPKATGRYYKAMAPYIYGAYVSLPQDYYLFKYINAYVASKILWDTFTDVKKLLDDHYAVMFGPAASTMEKIYSRFEENWIERIRGNTVKTSLGETAIPPSEYELWNNVYSQKEMTYINGLFDRAELEAAKNADCLERVKFMRKNLFGPLVEERKKHEKNLNKIADLNFHAYKLSKNESITIDGNVSENAWGKIKGLFLRKFSKGKGNPQKVNTIVKVLQDEKNLYISFLCDEPNMENDVSSNREKDSFGMFKDSSVQIFLNPSGDKQNYYQIVINSSGSITDIASKKLGSSQKLDKEWDSGVAYKVKKSADSWAVELSIPLEKLQPFKKEGFPINFNRKRVMKNEPQSYYTWSPYIKKGFHEIENFGKVKFQSEISGNLIRNSDFTGEVKGRTFDGWWIHNRDLKNASWTISADEFIKGGKSLMLKSDGKENIVAKCSLPELKPDTNYRLTFFIKTNNIVITHRSGGVMTSIWDEKNRYFPTNPYVGTIPWSKQGFTFKTSRNVNAKYTSYIALFIRKASGTVWFDDVRLVEQ